MGEGMEPNGLAGSIRDVLLQSHWQTLTWNWVGAGAAAGILVVAKPNSDAGIDAACDALVSAFRSAHLDAAKEPGPGPDWEQFGGMLNGPNPPSPTEAPIRIIIGNKPQ
jgi:hypothetical protein